MPRVREVVRNNACVSFNIITPLLSIVIVPKHSAAIIIAKVVRMRADCNAAVLLFNRKGKIGKKPQKTKPARNRE